MTPAETLRYLRREHAQIDHPVACCRKDHQNWPCDTIRGLDAATAAERERVAQLAEQHEATYRPEEADLPALTGVPGLTKPGPDPLGDPFAALIRETP